MNEFINALNWRYATKQFDPQKKVSDSDFSEVMESLRLSPSSFGLQPWRFVVVSRPEIREQLKPISWNQSQITDASHLLVLCILEDMTMENVDAYIETISQTRNVSKDSLSGYRNVIESFVSKFSKEEKQNWMKRQLYIAFGMLMSACAYKHIDSCPIEGFDSAACDSLLNLQEKGLKSVVLCAIGYRSESDKYAEAKKVRFDTDHLFLKI